jgi:transposase
LGLDASGQPLQKVKFRRDALLQFFEAAAPAVVGMEACAGSQWLARKIKALGHTVRIVPAQFVKPYVKSNKNDLIDAACHRRGRDAADDALRRAQVS